MVFYSIHKDKCNVELQAPSMGFSVSCLFDSILSILPLPSAFSHISSQLKGPRDLINLISSTLSHRHRSQLLGVWQFCRISVVCQPCVGRASIRGAGTHGWPTSHCTALSGSLSAPLQWLFPHFLPFSQILSSANGSSLLVNGLASYFPERT